MRILVSQAAPDDAAAHHVRRLIVGLTTRHHQVTVHAFKPIPELSKLPGARVVVGSQLADLLLDGGFDVIHLTSADLAFLGPWACQASVAPVVLTVSRPMVKMRVAGLAHVIFTSNALRQQVKMVAGHPRISVLPSPERSDEVARAIAYEGIFRTVLNQRHHGFSRWISAQLSGDRRRRTLVSRPDPFEPAVKRVGVVITSYRRPASLRRCVDGVATLTGVAAVCVVDNSPDPEVIERPRDLAGHIAFDVVADGVNHGLSRALAMGWERLADTDAILVLDDDTVPTMDLLNDFIAAMEPGTGAVGLPDQYSARFSGAGPPRLFAWSPSLIRTRAIHEVGPPRSELFFGLDDFEFSLRLIDAGWRVAWVPHEVAELRADTTWPERHYFSVRNSVWLVTRTWPAAMPLWLMTGDILWMLGSMCDAELRSRLSGRAAGSNWRGVRAGVAGLVHGLIGRVGTPPRWVLDGRESPETSPVELA
jgi:Glycosyl transferase family 2